MDTMTPEENAAADRDAYARVEEARAKDELRLQRDNELLRREVAALASPDESHRERPGRKKERVSGDG